MPTKAMGCVFENRLSLAIIDGLEPILRVVGGDGDSKSAGGVHKLRMRQDERDIVRLEKSRIGLSALLLTDQCRKQQRRGVVVESKGWLKCGKSESHVYLWLPSGSI